jgi:hypothetical protein
LFHHGTIVGGSWDSPSKQLVSILKFDNDAKPIQLIQKSVKDVKVKSHSFEEFASSIENCASFENMKNPKLDFPYKNILPIPNLLHHHDSQLREQSPTRSMNKPELKDDMDNEEKSTSEDGTPRCQSSLRTSST